MSIPRLLIHIGVPKSASTSLQFGFFPSHPDIRYLGKPYYDAAFGYDGSLVTAELIDSLWKQDGLEFDLDLARQRFDVGVRPRLGERQLAVLSEEGLSQASAADRSLTSRRVADLCRGVDCSILITLREQKSALFSGHQWINARRLVSLGFDAWIDWCRSYSSYYGCNNDFPLRQYRYARLVENYVELFGREKIMVLPMEMLSRAPRQFFTTLEDFARIRTLWGREDGPALAVENRSPGRLGIRYQRAIKGSRQLAGHLRGRSPILSEALEQGSLHRRIMRWIERIDTPMQPMSKATAAWLDDYYRADNQALVELTGLDLAAYGYVC